METQSTMDVLKEPTGISIGWAALMTVLGLAAVLMPLATGIAVSVFVGWIIVFGGFAYAAYAFAVTRRRSISLANVDRSCLRDRRRLPGVSSGTHPGVAHARGCGNLLCRGRVADRGIFSLPQFFRLRMDSL